MFLRVTFAYEASYLTPPHPTPTAVDFFNIVEWMDFFAPPNSIACAEIFPYHPYLTI